MRAVRPRGFTATISLTALLLAAAVTGTAAARTIDAVEACNQRSDRLLQIMGCTTLIELRRIDDRNRAIALHLRGSARHALGQLAASFRDYVEALRLSPHNGSARAGFVLVADALSKDCSPWAPPERRPAVIESCSIVIEDGGLIYGRQVITRARVDRGLLLQQAGRTGEALADFRAVVLASSEAAAGDRTRAQEELDKAGPDPHPR